MDVVSRWPHLGGAAIACILFLSAGCATVKPYPFCSYDGLPDDSTFERHLKKSIEALRAVTGEDELNVQYIDVQNRRWILVETDSINHRKIVGAWPPLACIASKPYSGDLGARKYRTCLLTVERNITADTVVGGKDGPEFENETIDSDSLVPSRLLWCNGWESLP